MVRKWLLILVLLAIPVRAFAGRALFEASATIIRSDSKSTSQWPLPNTYDAVLRGDDGKLFLLHFHGRNPLVGLQGQHVRIQYIQKHDDCQTGFVDELLEIQ